MKSCDGTSAAWVAGMKALMTGRMRRASREDEPGRRWTRPVAPLNMAGRRNPLVLSCRQARRFRPDRGVETGLISPESSSDCLRNCF